MCWFRLPLHWKRGWSRRYNQSGALARVIERQTGVKLSSEALRRVRPTQQQIGLSRKERASNVCRARSRSPPDRQSLIHGLARVVLIDDVPDFRRHGVTPCARRALLRAKGLLSVICRRPGVSPGFVDTHKIPHIILTSRPTEAHHDPLPSKSTPVRAAAYCQRCQVAS